MGKNRRKEAERKERNIFRTSITSLGASFAFLVALGLTGGDAEAAGLVMPAGGGVALGVEQILYQSRRRREAKVAEDRAAVANQTQQTIVQAQNQLKLKRAVFTSMDGEELPPRFKVAREVADEALRFESPDLASLRVAIQTVDRLTGPQSITSPEMDRAALSRFMTQLMPTPLKPNQES